jgi:AcrR family transcriptional regulator
VAQKNNMFSDRQNEIIQVSLRLIADKGIQNLTIKNLSKKIGISEPAIYRHFDSKIDILIAILDFFSYRTKEIFENELKSNSPALEKIQNIYKKHFQYLENSPSVATVLFSEEIFKNYELLIAKIQNIIEKKDKILQKIITEGQAKGEIKPNIDPKCLSTIIMGTLRLFVKKWQLSNYSYNIENQGEKLFDTLKILINT